MKEEETASFKFSLFRQLIEGLHKVCVPRGFSLPAALRACAACVCKCRIMPFACVAVFTPTHPDWRVAVPVLVNVVLRACVLCCCAQADYHVIKVFYEQLDKGIMRDMAAMSVFKVRECMSWDT